MVPDYAYQVNAIRRLRRRCRVQVIGKSLCGRPIFALRFGGARDCPLVAAGFHGMEYLTVLAVLRYAAVCDADAVLVPCVNPDGTEIALHGAAAAGAYCRFVAATGKAARWQANARGVDINHNFDADWRGVRQRERAAGITSPAATRYGGDCPASEPETQALVRLCCKSAFRRVLALHSQGREIYWQFGAHTPPGCLPLARKMGEVSGYRVALPEPLATGGGFKDWFIEAFHRCGYTVEMGLGQNPLPLSAFEAEYPLVQRMLDVFMSG